MTIVINTTREENEQINILFKIPFSEEQMVSFDTGLNDIGECASEIYNRIVDESYFIDSNYKIVILVDKKMFPYKKYRLFSDYYSKLILLYIKSNLIDVLSEKQLPPAETMVVFIDCYDTEELPYNFDVEEKPVKTEVGKTQNKKNNKSEQKDDYDTYIPELDENGMVIEKTEETNKPDPAAGEKPEPIEERICRKLFDLYGEGNNQNITLKLNIDQGKELYLDFDSVFSNLVSDSRASRVAKERDFLVKRVYQITEKEIPYNFIINSVLCRANTQRETVYAYLQAMIIIQRYVQTGITEYKEPANIEELLEKGYRKYSRYSKEENIPVKFIELKSSLDDDTLNTFSNIKMEDVSVEPGNSNSGSHHSDLNEEDESEDKSIIDEGKELLKAVLDESEYTGKRKKGRLDDRFNCRTEAIMDLCSDKVIKEQNSKMIDICLNEFHKWRDFKTVSSLKEQLDKNAGKVAANSNPKTQEELQIEFENLKKEYEDKKKESIEGVITVEESALDYSDILLSVNKLDKEYEHVKKKGKLGKVSFFGGICAVLLFFLSYVIYYSVADWSDILRIPVYIFSLIGFSAAYFVAFTLFENKIRKQKTDIINEAEELYAGLKEQRENSLKRLQEYYRNILPKSEINTLWWQIVQQRNDRNLELSRKRNEHLKLFGDLKLAVLSIATRMKIEIDTKDDEDTHNPDSIAKEFDVSKSYFENPNLQYYSFFDAADFNREEYDEEGEEE